MQRVMGALAGAVVVAGLAFSPLAYAEQTASPPPDIIVSEITTPPMPKGNPGTWASTGDYPAAALRYEIEGISRFRLNVDAQGMVTECTITESSGNADLDAATCRLMRERARFESARDADGNAISGTWASAVRWSLPEDNGNGSAPPPLPTIAPHFSGQSYEIIVGVDGNIESCLTRSAQGEAACPTSSVGRFWQVFRDKQGQPVRVKVIMKATTSIEIIPD